MGRRLTSVLGLLALIGAAAVAARTTTAFAGIPNITVDYYDVSGGDALAIRAALEKVRPTDPHDGARVDALSNAEWRWAWGGGKGGCDLATATIVFRGTVRLPRLADPAALPAPDRAAWDSYITALEAHEAWHLRNGYDGRLEILAAIKGATCGTANDAAKAAAAAVNARDAYYDKLTDHGRVGGAVF